MAATRLIPMHISKGWSLKDSIKAKTDYAENPEKTNDKEYVSSYACSPQAAAEEFLLAYTEYEKHARRKYDHEVIAYQIRQSFKPGEITPEEANRVGYETAMRFTKGKHAFIVATHTDRAHIHNHVVFCASDISNTRKFKNFFFSSFALQRVSDLVCLEHGLSVIKPRPYNEREKRTVYPKRESFRDDIRMAIDVALSKRPKDFDEFLLRLQKQGYEIKRGKHTAVRGKNQKRFIRLRSLGDGYTEKSIREKLGGIEKGKAPSYKDEDFDLLLNLQDVVAKGKGPGYEMWAKKFNVKNVMKAILFLQENGVRSYEELAKKAESTAKRFDDINSEIKGAEKRMQEITDLRNYIFNYSKTKETYVNYRKSGYSKKYFSEHREDIMKHKEAKEAFEKLGSKKLPTVQELNTEFQELLTKKKAAYKEYNEAKDSMTKYQIAKYDIDKILGIGEENKKDHNKEKTR
ncbi:Relaxase/Mobilisation nuclease domain-containing protein [Butyrivibrio sp. ob235]|uniref:relaxase/mobilization nuclease domain-containing protein n=1 Tax=Butyrivibrio sp. ob235 TaxID=1761780 RepID=UPI0008B0A883|nr:relaxase/mobilization nuclease domain-containing protein [Butyrivibrio sp. ob235]SEM20013.1 Relaxase/Mobilisation nuclease domain-containing protein [Butyrivibrio sp. ob235]